MSRYFKMALFFFICSIVFALTSYILNVVPLLWLAVITFLCCIATMVTWLCTVVFHRFKHSLTIVCIIIFSTLSIVTHFLNPYPIYVETVYDLANLQVISLVFVLSVVAAAISILVLIAQLIFGEKAPSTNDDNTSAIENTVAAQETPLDHQK